MHDVRHHADSFPQDSACDLALATTRLRGLEDHCARHVDELADRIGVDKLTLIGWFRSDPKFARFAESKIARAVD